MQMVVVLVGIMIAMVFGVKLLPTISSSTASAAADTNVAAQGLGGIVNLLPLIFLAVMIIGAVAYIRTRG